MSYVHEKYEQSKNLREGGEKKATKAVVAMLCKMKNYFTIRVLYFILFVLRTTFC